MLHKQSRACPSGDRTPSGFPSLSLPPSLALPAGCHRGGTRRLIAGGRAAAQVAPPVTWMHLSADPPGGADRKPIVGQVTPSGGPSCPRTASQGGRMRSAVLRRRSLALPSSARRREKHIIDSRHVSCSPIFKIPLFVPCRLSAFFPLFCLLSAPTTSYCIVPPLHSFVIFFFFCC